jgi:drug/metabolite transporter (DMT)-like permease
MMKKNIGAYLQLTGAMVIVGSNIALSKMITVGFPVFLAAALRFALAATVLLVLLFKSAGGFPRIERRDLLILFLQSLTGNFLYTIFLLYGLKLTSAAESGIISGTVPAIIGLISFLFLRERLSWSKWLGIGLVMVGMMIMNGQAGGGEQTGNLPGNLLIVGAAIGEALWSVLSKATAGKIAPLALACVTSCFGFLLFLPIAIYQSLTFNFAAVPLVGWGEIAYYGLIGTVGAYLLWYQAVVKVSATTAGVFTGLAPVSAVVLSYVVLGEPFAWAHVVGGVCVLLAIVLIARVPHQPEPVAREAIYAVAPVVEQQQ